MDKDCHVKEVHCEIVTVQQHQTTLHYALEARLSSVVGREEGVDSNQH